MTRRAPIAPRRAALLGALAVLALAALGAPAAQAATRADVKATWGPSALPGGGEGQITLQARNIGDADLAAGFTISDVLPEGVSATAIAWPDTAFEEGAGTCTGDGPGPAPGIVGAGTIGCELSAADLAKGLGEAPGPFAGGGLYAEPTGYLPQLFVDVAIEEGAAGTATNTATVSGGGAPPQSDVDEVPFGAPPAGFGLIPHSFGAELFELSYPEGAPARRAGDHPAELRVDFDLTSKSLLSPIDGTRETRSTAKLRDVEVTLPRGAIGNPEALPKCDPTVFAQGGAVANATACPPSTQIGYLNVAMVVGGSNNGRGCCISNTNALLTRVALYNLEPPTGTPVDLAFNAVAVQGHIYAALDPAQDYAIRSLSPDISASVDTRGTEVTLWGVPGDPAHDRFRYHSGPQEGGLALGAPFAAPIRPFLTNPMDCGAANGGARIRVDSYEQSGSFSAPEEYPEPLDVERCEDPRFGFAPEISLQPTDRHAGAPTGLDVHLEVPQRDLEVDEARKLYAANGFVKGISTPPIKKAVVTFPQGMTISPSAAQGLKTCTSEQIGLGTDRPVACPDASQFGTLTLHTPILPVDEQPEGFIYVARQSDNPFHNFLSLYLVISEPQRGILIKIPGRVDLDPASGQITTSFEDLPQFPVSDMQMTFKGGVRAALVNPATCGQKTIRATFYSWHDPQAPHPVDSSYEITQNPDGSPCPASLAERPFAPALEAGTANDSAGRYAPLLLRLARGDEDQEFAGLELTLPRGLVGKLAGVGECPDAGIAQAAARTAAGQGALELAAPSCPPDSYIGSTQAGAGVGVPLTYVPGRLHLAGPYRGAPLSVVAITPARVGPYDLGAIAVRAALDVDPRSAQVSVATDPLPLIYQGIPLRLRDIRVSVDRPQLTLNPTGCEAKAITARVRGTGGEPASAADDSEARLSQRFQASECASLAFAPRLSLRLFGATRRGAHPKLRALFRPHRGQANTARAAVTLPRSEFLDQGHIRTVCTRVQFANEACPRAAIYGSARAKTPLLDEVLSGPIYLRSSNHKLPDLLAAFRGGRVDFDLLGRIDSRKGGIRASFEALPDVPVSWAAFTFAGGRKGLLVNSRDLCRGRAQRAAARLRAHNGRRRTLRPPLRRSCAAQAERRRR